MKVMQHNLMFICMKASNSEAANSLLISSNYYITYYIAHCYLDTAWTSQ